MEISLPHHVKNQETDQLMLVNVKYRNSSERLSQSGKYII